MLKTAEPSVLNKDIRSASFAGLGRGNTCIKWLRNSSSAQPLMTREETSQYTDLMPDGTARQFTMVMEAKYGTRPHRVDSEYSRDLSTSAVWRGAVEAVSPRWR